MTEKVEQDAVELLPCPFCGSLACIEKFDKWVVFCPHENKECMVVETKGHFHRDDAIKQWNTRSERKI